VLIILKLNRKHLHDVNSPLHHQVSTAFGALYEQYEEPYWWYEIIELVKKMLLTGAMCVIGNGSSAQLLVAILLVLFFMLLVFKTAPFIDDVDDMLSFMTSLQMMLTLMGGFALLTDNDNEYDRDTFGTALVAINCFAIMFLLLSSIALIPAVRSRLNKCARGIGKDGENEENLKPDINPTTSDTKNSKNTHVVPISVANGSNDDDDDHDFSYEASKKHRRKTMSHSSETLATAHAIHEEFHESEHALRKEQQKKQQRQRRSTQLRVMARLKIRKTNALTKVPLFKNSSAEAIESILELTTYKKVRSGTCLCVQGELANDFYIIVSGRCSVRVRVEGKWNSDSNRRAQRGEAEENNEEKAEIVKEGVNRRVGTLKDLDFFGESALLGAHEDGGQPKRNASVAVESEYVQLLMLSRANFELLLQEGVLSNDVVNKVTQENRRRSEINMKDEAIKTSDFAVPQPTTSMPSSTRSTVATETGSSGVGAYKNGGGVPPPPPKPPPQGVML